MAAIKKNPASKPEVAKADVLPGLTQEATSNAPKAHKTEKVGPVISTKMQKTIIVQTSRRVPHPLYRRIVTKHKKFYAHDEEGTARVGDIVRIIECRPLSKLKRWRLDAIVRRSVLAGTPAPSVLDVKV
jgi:small subunit ribosomal protein S17